PDRARDAPPNRAPDAPPDQARDAPPNRAPDAPPDQARVEEKYRNLFQLSNDAAFLLDASDGRILEANERALEWLGYTAAELERLTFRELHPPEVLAEAEDRFREVVEAGRVRLTSVLLRKNGETFPAEISAISVRHDDQTLVQAAVRDISERVEAMESLRASEERYRALFERNVAGVFRSTLEGVVLEVNEACARLLGYSPEEMAGISSHDLYMRPEDRETFRVRLLAEGAVRNCELRLRRKDGSPVWVLENSMLVEDPVHGERVIEGTLIGITDRKRLEADLEHLAYHDALTGLANRRLLEERARKTLALAGREGRRAGLVFIDLARFKRINDTLGHAVGDSVLAETANRLRAVARESDTVARMGGDEFAVLLAEVDGVEGARVVAERLWKALQEPLHLAGRTLHADARLGVALYPDHASDYEALLSAADRAMYRTMTEGVLPYRLYDPALEGTFEDELALEEGLREALEAEELTLYYQPICRGGDGRVEGAEALLRWPHPERGVIAAAEFIHLAERTPLIHQIDRWALREGIRQASEWEGGDGPDWVAVNLSAASFRDPELVAYVSGLLEEARLDPSCLVVEVTERTAMRNPEAVNDCLRGLREVGARIAIDDFGTGHSALAYLRQLPADLLKLDGVFIRDLEADPGAGRIARAVIALGHAAGMAVVAERVERRAQREWLEAAGCDFVQGYHVGEPAPPDALVV
ncbi:MAG: putative bifunctional diguanylate cyclase/phosphodiesterase, partial [Gemmatimonadota bacterium]